MTQMIDKHGLRVAAELADFLDTRALPGTGVDPDAFWRGVADIYDLFAPENAALLAVRDTMQAKIDAWHQARAGVPIDMAAYQAFLRDIGYLVAEPAPFAVAPTNVDDEIARLAGAQLVVPVLNARFVLNAAMFGLAAFLIRGFGVDGFWPALWGALAFGVLSWIANSILLRERD